MFPEENLLFLVCANGTDLEEVLEEKRAWLLEDGADTGLKVPQVTEDALLKLLLIDDWLVVHLEFPHDVLDNVGASHVVLVLPEDAGNKVIKEGEPDSLDIGLPTQKQHKKQTNKQTSQNKPLHHHHHPQR